VGILASPPVRQRERQRTARHQSLHVAAAYFVGEVLDDVESTPPRDAGYVTGAARRLVTRRSALVLAAGCFDGHGSGADEFELEQLVPDANRRAEVLAVAARVMERPEFIRVRNELWRALTFRDRLSHREIERIASLADDMGVRPERV
jgi:hypothetical protein